MDDIVLLQSDQRAAAALWGALDPQHSVTSVGNLADLEALLGGGTVRGCILDLFDSSPSVSLSSLSSLRREHPTVALVIASDFRGREMQLYDLGRLQADGVIRMEEDPSPRDILHVVDRALATSLATRVVLSCAEDLPPLPRQAIRWAIEHAEERPQVSEFAAALGTRPRSFHREMKTLGFLSPRALLLWGRLIRASDLLGLPSETVESVAFRLGYATGGGLGKAMKRQLGFSPIQLVRQGGLTRTLEVFRRCGLRERGRDEG